MKIVNELRMIFPMAMRNIARNIKRTLLSGSTITLAAAAMCLMFAFENAMVDDMKTNIINHLTGHVRVRNAQFSQHERIQPLQFSVPQTEQFIEQAQNFKGVTLVTPKISAGAALYINDDIQTAQAVGVDFETSRFFSGPNTVVVSGKLPAQNARAGSEDNSQQQSTAVRAESDGSPRALPQTVVSEGLAKRFGIKTGDKFTFMTTTASGGTNGVTVQTAAVVHISDVEFNNSAFFLDWQTLSRILRMQGNASEVLVYVDSSVSAKDRHELTDQLQSLYTALSTSTGMSGMPALSNDADSDGASGEVLEWTKVSMMYQMFQLVDIIYLYMGLIFFLLASTVIFNTTMMSVLERKKEIGTLMSLGMEPPAVMHLFLLETTCIAFISSFIGVVIGAVGVIMMGKTGFDLGAMGGDSISGMNFSSWIYPRLNAARYVMIFVVGTLTAAAACIIPARMTMKVQPAEALRSEN